MTTSNDSAAWAHRADELARWAMARLANRTDRYGCYLVRDGRTAPMTAPAHGPEPDALSLARLVRHFRARGTDDVVGTHTLGPDGTGKTTDVDVDAHPGTEADPEPNERFAVFAYDSLVGYGFSPLMYESNGKGGYHCRVLFREPVPGDVLYRFGRFLTADHTAAGLADRPESYPKQPALTASKRWGGWLRCPGRHHTREFWPRVYNGTAWVGGAAAVDHLLSLTGDAPALIPFEALVAEAERIAPQSRTVAPGPAAAFDGRPGDDFNRRATWVEVLEPHGWTLARRRSEAVAEWSRPGKAGGVSATTGYCVADGRELLYVFTTNAAPLPAGKAADKFGVYTLLNHRGDFKAAAAALRARGYGPQPVRRGRGYVSF